MTLVGRITAFGAFFKRYARTWQHAVATAGLTAFGMLTFVNGIFAVVALLTYVLPPLVLYTRSPEVVEETTTASADNSDGMAVGDRDQTNGDGSTEWSTSTWRVSAVPTNETLADVAVDDEHAYAVGTAGTVLRDVGNGWEPIVVDGPDARSNALTSVDTTATGAVWFAGDSGIIGRIDTSADHHVSHSEPNGDTTNIIALAATSTDDREIIILADGSGQLRRGRYIDGEMAWDEPIKPGSGSSLGGVVFPTTEHTVTRQYSLDRITTAGSVESYQPTFLCTSVKYL